MNCKQGELAIIINSMHTKELIGKIVTCVKRVPKGFILHGGYVPSQLAKNDDVWIVRFETYNWLHSDSRLRPIRYNDGEDEIIRIAGKLQKETA